MENFFDEYIDSEIPENILDFHVHMWKQEQWNDQKDGGGSASERYMVSQKQYPLPALSADAALCFPGKKYHAVCFGNPGPLTDTLMTNGYIANCAKQNGALFPLMVAGGGRIAPEILEESLERGGFLGYKVYLNWVGNDYRNVKVEDMLTPFEKELANLRHLVILLHVPGSGRLADPEIQQGVINLAKECPETNVVLAHCGRCYHPLEIFKAEPSMGAMAKLGNVYMDTAMVMEPAVIETAIKAMGHGKILFGTDLPIAAMTGKRVNILDHWVDVVKKGYPESDFRVASDMFGASYMAREICLAVLVAAKLAGLGKRELDDIFFENGMRIIKKAAAKKGI
ncbi:MAG: amidohydrolase [Oscillospiraceae bacterium]|nr:amidohydrolase [Oscillospiraceae bacterium]